MNIYNVIENMLVCCLNACVSTHEHVYDGLIKCQELCRNLIDKLMTIVDDS